MKVLHFCSVATFLSFISLLFDFGYPIIGLTIIIWTIFFFKILLNRINDFIELTRRWKHPETLNRGVLSKETLNEELERTKEINESREREIADAKIEAEELSYMNVIFLFTVMILLGRLMVLTETT